MWVGAGSSLSAATPPGADDCEALPAMDFTSIQDAPTQATATRMVEATGEVPAHCRMDGYVTPNVRIVLDLPNSASWNGKYLQASPGGQGGSTEQEAGWCDEALRRGYACLTHDTGHFGMTRRSSWAYNNLQAELDYGIRGHHVAALAGKAITEHYYGRAPAFSYHVGCSAGGKQGMVQASRFPWNFDGILAQEPANVTAVGVMILWNALASYDADGQPLFTPADLDVLHAGAIAACDADDGLEDGIIGGDPRTCQFDPADLACASGQTSGCLSPVQVEAARREVHRAGDIDRREAQQVLPVLSCLARFGEGQLLLHGSRVKDLVGAVQGVQSGSGTELEGVRLRLGPRLQAHGDFRCAGEWLQQSRSAQFQDGGWQAADHPGLGRLWFAQPTSQHRLL